MVRLVAVGWQFVGVPVAPRRVVGRVVVEAQQVQIDVLLDELVVPLFEELGETELYRIALELERQVGEVLDAKGLAPNVDFYSSLIYSRLGIPADAFTCLFAWARTVGWLAHWQEQIQEARTFRPTQVYVGARDRTYKPPEERG